MNPNRGSIEGLNIETWALIERQLLRFEHAWREPPPPELNQFLNLPAVAETWHEQPGNSEPQVSPRSRLMVELIKIDLEHRWKQGLQFPTATYLSDYPELDTPAISDELIRAEFEARGIAGRLPERAEIQDRFAESADHWMTLLGKLQGNLDSTTVDSATHASNEFFSAGSAEQTSASQRGPIGDLKPGDRLQKYLLRERIGHGSYSIVWRASDPYLNRDVALKILRPDKIEHDESAVRRMIREAQAVAAIDHPAVVKIHEVSRSNNCTFIVEQLIDGPNLKTAIDQEIPTPTRSAEIVRDVGLAVHAAHSCGIVHRDIKPANILLSGGKTPMLVDFGLAYLERIHDATLTQQGELLGTPAYMSPEQALGQVQLVDARTDIYSLGAVLYHLLTGELPFAGSMLSVLDDVIKKAPNRLNLTQHAVDRDLETIVLKCLEKEPSDRYASAKQLADELQRHLDGEPIHARPVGMMQKTWKWSKRHPRWAGAVIGFIVLAAFLMGTLLQLRSVSAQRTRAELAEQRAHQLLLDSTKTAGRLAMQRGKMSDAVNHFRQAQTLSSQPDPGLHLDLVECLIATRQIEAAETELREISVEELPSDVRGQGRFLQAQLKLETGDPGEAEPLFVRAHRETLSPGRAAYVQAMLAPRSPEVVETLKTSLEIEPLSHHPRRMLITMLLSLAEFEEASSQIKIAQQLFPEDLDFQLLNVIVLASTDRLEAAKDQIETVSLPPKQKENWRRLCDELDDFRTVYNHRQQEFGFNQASLSRLSRMYLEIVGPCLAERGFVFPPKIAVRFSELVQCLEAFSRGEIDLTETWPELSDVVEIHPEGSLIILDLSTLLNQDKIAEAYERCRKIESAKGFVRDSDELLAEIQFTSAMVQFAGAKQKSEPNEFLKTGTEAIIEFESSPYLIERFSENAVYCRIVTIFLIESFKAGCASEPLAQKWLARLKSNPAASRQQSIWFEAVLANRAGRPVEALELLAALADHARETGDPLGQKLKSEATAMHQAIVEVLESNLKKSATIELDEIK